MDKSLSIILKETISISDVVGQYLSLSKRGKNFFALCPFHSDNNPSLVVNNEKRHFKCFVCGAGGDLITFVMKKENISFSAALIQIAKKYNVESSEILTLEKKYQLSQDQIDFYEMNSQASEIYHNFLMQKENEKIRNYLYERGLTNEDLKKFQIGYAPSQTDFLTNIMTNRTNIFGENRDAKLIWNPNQLIENQLIAIDEKDNYQDFFRNRIIFPIRDEWKKIVGFSGRDMNLDSKVKYLNSRTSKYFKKDQILYNMENIWNKNYKKLYLTEGFFDVILTSKNGIENIVGTMGLALSWNHINKLRSQKIETIVVAMDNDKPGIISNIKVANLLIENFEDVMILKAYDNDCKDLADLSNKLNNKEQFQKKLQNYETFIEYFINYSFSKEDIAIEKKHKALKLISKKINSYSSMIHVHHYAKLIAEKSGFVFEDVLKSIEYFAENKANENEIIQKKENLKVHDFIYDDKQLNLNDFSDSMEDKLSFKCKNYEREILFIMINNEYIANLFIDNLNVFYYQKQNKYFSNALNIVRSLIANENKNYSRVTFFKEYKLYFDDELQIKKDYEKNYKNVLKVSLIQGNINGIELIIRLVQAAIKRLEPLISKGKNEPHSAEKSNLNVYLEVWKKYKNNLEVLKQELSINKQKLRGKN